MSYEPEEKPKKVYKFPANMAVCADMYYKLREKRLVAQRVAAVLDDEENALELHIINKLPVSQASGIAGKLVRVGIDKKSIPVVKDWQKFYGHILRTKSFELLNRAVNAKAVKERWANGKPVPGVDKFTKKVLTVNKLKGVK